MISGDSSRPRVTTYRTHHRSIGFLLISSLDRFSFPSYYNSEESRALLTGFYDCEIRHKMIVCFS